MARTYIRGVDEPLPDGETLLWQGSPATGPLARHALRVRWIAGYFLVLALFAGLGVTGQRPVREAEQIEPTIRNILSLDYATWSREVEPVAVGGPGGLDDLGHHRGGRLGTSG